jgi:serine/threonine protein kinase
MALFRPGEVIAGRYQIGEELGSGSMGVVFAAIDSIGPRGVAVKFMLPKFAKDQDLCERFLAEASAAARLTSQHVAWVYQTGTHRTHSASLGLLELPYIVMELLRGRTLDDLLRDPAPPSIAESVDYTLQACLALADAHGQGIIHRDLKPANLYVDQERDGRKQLKVLDFGIAKVPTAAAADDTAPALGTPAYMAPEQWYEASKVDQRADIWALGAILYRLLVGDVPFRDDRPDVLSVAIQRRQPALPHQVRPEVPEELSATVMRCLAKNPIERFQDVAELAAALGRFGLPGRGRKMAREVRKLLAAPPAPESLPASPGGLRPLMPPPVLAVRETEPIRFSGQQQQHRDGVARWNDQLTLVKALTKRWSKGRPVTFLVGSALTAPYQSSLGVPTVDGIIALIRDRLDVEDLAEFDMRLNRAGVNRYQEAFEFLLAREGADAVSEVIRVAVLNARRSPGLHDADAKAGKREACRALEHDVNGWAISPALQSLGELVTQFPDVFGRMVLTSNFDPLTEVSITRAGGRVFRTALHGDGEFQRDEGEGCDVVHFHGDWFRTDTLHTPNQVSQRRPRLSGGLEKLMREQTLVVMGYGGWDDVFTRTLIEVVKRGGGVLDVLWAFHSDNKEHLTRLYSQLFDELHEVVARGRVLLYKGVDIHWVLPELARRVREADAARVSGVVSGIPSSEEPASARELPDPSDIPPRFSTMVSIQSGAQSGGSVVAGGGTDEERAIPRRK